MAQDEISKKVELNWLSAFYGGLLTDKQRQVLTLHCEEDLSLTEIAQEVGISRQGVHELLTRAARKMFEMEEKLHVAARFQRVENGLEKCRTMMREGRYDDAERMIDALIRLIRRKTMAFEGLTEKLQGALRKLSSKGKLTEDNVKEGMREVRMALLEADVNYAVAKDFIKKVTARCVGTEITGTLSASQQVIKIVNEEMTAADGRRKRPPDVVVRARRRSTCSAACRARAKPRWQPSSRNYLAKQGKKPLLAACDIYRPAAINQLQVVGKQVDVPVYRTRHAATRSRLRKEAVEHARYMGRDVLIIDTAGRLHIDEELMDELRPHQGRRCNPQEILLVVDAMTGQDAVNVAQTFNEKLDIDGVILTKLDGDTRGGAALSVRAVTGKPIKFMRHGRKARTTSSPSTPTAWPAASWAWATC